MKQKLQHNQGIRTRAICVFAVLFQIAGIVFLEKIKGSQENLTGMLWLNPQTAWCVLVYSLFSFALLMYLVYRMIPENRMLFASALIIMTGLLLPYRESLLGSMHTLVCTTGVVLWCVSLLWILHKQVDRKIQTAVRGCLLVNLAAFALYGIQARITLEAEMIFLAGQTAVLAAVCRNRLTD